jgi:hypothetical protein
MNLSSLLGFAAGAIGGVIAFLVALLPERIKEREPFSGFQSNAAHVFSGISECALALLLFFYGYDQFVGEFSQGIARAMAAEVTRNDITQAQISAMGVLGFVLYLFHPIAVISLYMVVEGTVRAFAAGLAGRCHGIAALWAIHRIAMFTRTKRREASLRKQLGPDEPDSPFKDETSGALVLTSIEDKDWRERQVAKWGDDFYILSTKIFVQKDKYHRYQYTFRRMHPGEIIRGAFVVIPLHADFHDVTRCVKMQSDGSGRRAGTGSSLRPDIQESKTELPR